jgi:FtsP/CotA-like multicopper oxidase with cupredoxin domain
VPGGPADVTLRIGPALVDIAKKHTISTIGYNGAVPGPVIRLREGVAVTVDLLNDTDSAELVHWHGLIIPADVVGAEEEKSLAVPAHGHLRYRLTLRPSGARFVHTHVMPMSDLSRGTYSGPSGFVYTEPKENPARYDLDIFLATHEWEPYLTTAEDEEEDDPGAKPRAPEKDEKPNGWEIGYQRFTINGRRLGHGEPARVKEGQRVWFHFLNACATENIQLAPPGHQFQVVALDGNPRSAAATGGCAGTRNGGAHRRDGGDEEPRNLDAGDAEG